MRRAALFVGGPGTAKERLKWVNWPRMFSFSPSSWKSIESSRAWLTQLGADNVVLYPAFCTVDLISQNMRRDMVPHTHMKVPRYHSLAESSLRGWTWKFG